MSVCFKVKYYYYEIGTSDFLFSFFSTVAYRAENGHWGSKFPHIMKELYDGTMKYQNIQYAIKELEEIKKELSKFKPDMVIWDINDLSKRPPWGNNISSDITDLSNYFVTSDGRDFIAVLFKALNRAEETKNDIEIVKG